MDITTDGFGFMLAVGDLAWVPFVYSLQARYLVFNQVELGPVKTALVIAVNLAGYYIFRSSNGEKNDFRNGRNPKSEFKDYAFNTYTNIHMRNRPPVHADRARHQASYYRLVGQVPSPELHVRFFSVAVTYRD